MTRMPPQAYTKEVLATAFDWLSRQSEGVKKSIRTSDDLVGLYLKSTRLKEHQEVQGQAGAYSTDLSSAKSFRNELQGLALNLKQFEDKPISEPKKAESPPSEYLHELSLMLATQTPEEQPMPQIIKEAATFTTPPSTLPSSSLTSSVQSADAAETVLLKLDKKTISAINLAKERLNLSSNTEAIRVLVSLGEKHLKKIFGTED